jgi:tetratricopeptide (TPR) repeat protein
VLDPATMGEEEVWRRLNEATRSGVDVKVDSAVFTFPQKIDGVQAGDDVLVYANVPEDRPVRISVGGGPFTEPTLVNVERPLLERAWVGAKIKSLVERERVEGASEALSKEIVGLSTQYRVISPKTSLLVLETDRDYARFGIDRRALADVLVTEGGRVSLLRRTMPAPPKPPIAVAQNPPPPAPKPKTKPVTSPRPAAVAAKPSPAKRGASPRFDIDDVGGGAIGGAQAAQAAPPRMPAPAPSAAPPRMPAPAEEAKSDEAESSLGRVGTLGHAAGTGPSPGGGAAPAASAAPRDERPAPRPASPPPSRSQPALEPEPVAASAPPPPRERGAASEDRRRRVADEEEGESPRSKAPEADPYTGPFKAVMDLVAQRRAEDALRAAFEWRKTAPGDVMALIALGEAFEAAGDPVQAARCYGSIIDLFPGRADLRRFAGERLERLASGAGLDLAADTFGKAQVERPDHPASHRLYAYALVKQGKPEQAFEAIVRGLRRRYPSDRFRGVTRILAEDLGLIGAAWAKVDPKRAEEIQARVRSEGGAVEDQPSLRFVLNWETDANDVDFHIHDGQGGHAFYSQPTLESGGELYADVTTGYGPECFTIRGPAARRAGPYRLQAHYYSRGPMGYGMGKLQILEHDGRGGLSFEERPFIVMVDRAFVDLGTVTRQRAKVPGGSSSRPAGVATNGSVGGRRPPP